MPRTASKQKRASVLHNRFKRATSSSELATTPVLLRLPEIESIVAAPELDDHQDDVHQDDVQATDTLAYADPSVAKPIGGSLGAEEVTISQEDVESSENSSESAYAEDAVRPGFGSHGLSAPPASHVQSAREKLATATTTAHAAIGQAAETATSEHLVVPPPAESQRTQAATDEAIAELPEGSWWEHWSSGVVLILLIIALVTASIIAFNDGADTDPSLLAEQTTSLSTQTDSLDLGEIVVPPVSADTSAAGENQIAENTGPISNTNSGQTPNVSSQGTTAAGVAAANVAAAGVAAGGSGTVSATPVSTNNEANPFSAQAASTQLRAADSGQSTGSVQTIAPQVSDADSQPIDLGNSAPTDSLIPDFDDGALNFSPEVTQPTLADSAGDVASQLQEAAQAASGIEFSNVQSGLPAISTQSTAPIHSSLSPPSGSNPPLLFGEPSDGHSVDSGAVGSTPQGNQSSTGGLSLSASSTAPQVPDLQMPNLQVPDLSGVGAATENGTQPGATTGVGSGQTVGNATTRQPAPNGLMGLPPLSGGMSALQVAGSGNDAKFSTATHSQAAHEPQVQASSTGTNGVSTQRQDPPLTDSDGGNSVSRPIETKTPESNADDIIGAYEFYERLSAPSTDNRYSPK